MEKKTFEEELNDIIREVGLRSGAHFQIQAAQWRAQGEERTDVSGISRVGNSFTGQLFGEGHLPRGHSQCNNQLRDRRDYPPSHCPV